MLSRNLLFFLLITLSAFPCFAAPIQSVTFSGNSAFTSSQIRVFLADAPLDSSQVMRDVETILQAYRDEGYHHAQIRWDGIDSTGTLHLHIEEGALVRVEEVHLSGNNSLRSELIRQRLDLRPGAVFRESVFQRDVDQILQLYENNGFPYAAVYPEDFRYSEDGSQLSFTLRIEEGNLARIESIRIVGNTVTRAEVIRRAMRIKIGETFDQQKLAAARRRLERLGFFAEVEPIRMLQGSTKNDAILLVTVREGRTSRVSGVVGYVPETPSQDAYWTGKIDLSFLNLVGTGRRVLVNWNRKDPYSSEIRFHYREPWILGSPLSVGIDLHQLIQDSLYTKRQAQFILDIPITETLTGELNFASEEVIPGAQANNPIAQSDKTFTGGSLTWDTRNSLYNPDRGSLYFFAANYGKRNYEDQPDASEVILRGRTEHYVPTFTRQAVAVALNGAVISSTDEVIPVHEQFNLGGTQSLRGYKEDQFRGERIGWSNVEYRFLLTRQSRFFLFVDSGFYHYRRYVGESTQTESIEAWKVGYGLGLRVASRIGMIGVDYGLGENDGLTEGKIHFGLEETF